MSYIAFDLDALNATPAVARAAGVSENDVIGGLLRLWAWCFREERDTCTDTHLRGHFGADVSPALEAFGFLEKRGPEWRIRGADRYLRVTQQRRNAGKARASSAGRSAGRFAGEQTSDTPAATSGPPADHQRATSPTPSTEHRTPNTESRTTAPRAASQSKSRPSDELVSDFAAITGGTYLWAGAKDGVALAALLKAATLEEVRTRWRRGLAAPSTAWASCRTVAELRSKWNHLGAPTRDVTRGVAEPSDWTGRETREVTL